MSTEHIIIFSYYSPLNVETHRFQRKFLEHWLRNLLLSWVYQTFEAKGSKIRSFDLKGSQKRQYFDKKNKFSQLNGRTPVVG